MNFHAASYAEIHSHTGLVLSIFTFFVLLSTFSPSFAATITYQYNALNRLESVNSGNGYLETYTYDGTYNRTSLTVEDVEPPTATITSNQIIISDGETTISGTASDPGSGVQKVEIFFDGGSIQITLYTITAKPTLYAGFTGNGLSKYSGASWNSINATVPVNISASGSVLYAGFTGSGLYKYDGTVWIQLTPNDQEKGEHSPGLLRLRLSVILQIS